jgi:thioredoxin 1
MKSLALLAILLTSVSAFAGDVKPLVLTKDNFQSATSKGIALVDFWAEWCGPCIRMAPILDDLAGKYEGRVTIAKVDIDANPALAEKFQIQSIPNLKIFKDGKVVDEIVGLVPKEQIMAKLDKYLK